MNQNVINDKFYQKINISISDLQNFSRVFNIDSDKQELLNLTDIIICLIVRQYQASSIICNINQSVLSTICNCSQKSIARSIIKLEQLGIVDRVTNDNDKELYISFDCYNKPQSDEQPQQVTTQPQPQPQSEESLFPNIARLELVPDHYPIYQMVEDLRTFSSYPDNLPVALQDLVDRYSEACYSTKSFLHFDDVKTKCAKAVRDSVGRGVLFDEIIDMCIDFDSWDGVLLVFSES